MSDLFPEQLFFTRSSSVSLREERMSLAPLRENSQERASPILEEAPVIHITLFAKSMDSVLISSFLQDGAEYQNDI